VPAKTRQQQHRQRVEKRQRREQAERDHFSEPMTGRQARRTARAESNVAYSDTLRQNAGLQRASKQQEARVGGWYDTFANEIAASRGEVAGAYDKANTAIAGNLQTAAADNTARNAALATQDAEFAKLTGGPQNTTGPQTDAAAQGQRELYGAALAAPVAAQGANAYTYLTNQRNNARGEGLKQRIDERKRGQSLQQDRTALLKERGQYRATKVQEMREAEQKDALERWKVNKAFPLEKAAAAADAADTAHDNALGDRNAGIAQQNANTSKYNAHHDGGEGGGDGNHEGRQNANATVQTLYERGPHPNHPKINDWKSWGELTQAVAEEAEVSPAEARAAVQRFRKRVEREKQQPGAGLGTGQGTIHR
jgi:hypothetical protein